MAQDDPEPGEDKSTKWAEFRTDLAEDRTIQATERTFAGWLRTAFAAIGVGIGFQVLFGEFAGDVQPRLPRLLVIHAEAGVEEHHDGDRQIELRVTVVVLSAIFPIIINVYTGARNVDAEYLEAAQAFAASRWQQLRTVIIPGSLPFVFAGLRIGVARSLIGVTVAEMTAAITGTGALLIAFGRAFATDRLFVPVIILGLLSIALGELVHLLQRRAMPWRRSALG